MRRHAEEVHDLVRLQLSRFRDYSNIANIVKVCVCVCRLIRRVSVDMYCSYMRFPRDGGY